jgi:hypothetical protein
MSPSLELKILFLHPLAIPQKIFLAQEKYFLFLDLRHFNLTSGLLRKILFSKAKRKDGGVLYA